MIVLKLVIRAARKSSRNAVATATIAKMSGIAVGTSARKRMIRTKKPAMRPMMSLAPCSGGGLSASPVNSTWIPAGSPMALRLSSTLTTSARGSSNPVRSNWASKNAIRPVFES